MTRRPAGVPSTREAGLRRLAAEGADRVDATLRRVLSTRRVGTISKKLEALDALVEGVASSMPIDASTDERVFALRRLIADEIDRVDLKEERTALIAALHCDPSNRAPGIDQRLAFARDRGDFGVKASGRQHGYDALRRWWGDGVRLLSRALDERLSHMQKHPDAWRGYFEAPTYRRPSRGAQPLFVECMVTTAYMKRRLVERRLTERLVTAREDGVEYFIARALPESSDVTNSLPVRPVWGCTAERIPSRPGGPVLTRLRFPKPLQRGQRHYFSSEAIVVDHGQRERLAINVEIDHHGIAPGRRLYDVMPVSGLTIRIRFDPDDPPECVWWYADQTERERYVQPEPGDERLIPLPPQGWIEHTFSEPCQPLANYGISFAWPAP